MDRERGRVAAQALRPDAEHVDRAAELLLQHVARPGILGEARLLERQERVEVGGRRIADAQRGDHGASRTLARERCWAIQAG